MTVSRRGFLAGVAGASLLVSGCGAGREDGAATAAAGFPVTVPGKLGATTVTAPPERVVAVGYLRDTDLAVALGAGPVLSVRSQAFAHGLAAWAQPPKSAQALYTDGGLPYEKIAAAAPDLILASDDYSLAADLPKLQKIAPTLGYLGGAGQDGWRQMIRRAGQVLGAGERAGQLVRQVEDKIRRAAYPGFAGRTFTFGPVSTGGVYTISSTTDAAATFFAQLGLKLSPKVTGLPASATPGRAQISPERLDLLDADVLVISYDQPSSRAALEADPLFRKLPAVRRGSYVPLDQRTAIAMAFPSVLSIPYALDALVPKLAAALGLRG